MGCTCSSSSQIGDPGDLANSSHSGSRHFIRPTSPEEVKSFFQSNDVDGTMLEFIYILDYPVARQCLLECLDSYPPFVKICFEGWLDIQSYNTTMVDGIAKSVMAQSICTKYVEGSSLVSRVEAARVRSKLNAHEAEPRIFDTTQALFFQLLHEHMFVKFRKTPNYEIMIKALRRKYNRVGKKDFKYCKMIGHGAYGVVLEVIKKSTGSKYAMKLQCKSRMMSTFRTNPWMALMEKQALSCCSHPFIVELSFAFQTQTMVAMVMTLCDGRDLGTLLRQNGAFTAEQVKFYSAESVSALSYLHQMGLVYRDFKPANIILNLDGHIKLVDFGGVCDLHGQTVCEY